jgi:hypothetical protein
MNICVNAVQAMEKDGGVLEIRVDTVALAREAAAVHPDLGPGRLSADRGS